MAGIDALGPGAAWVWIAVCAALAAAEAASRRRALLWVALAAFLTAAAVWLAPELRASVQAGVFAMLALALVAIGRSMPAPGPAAPPASLVGREAEVLFFQFHEGQVAIDGVAWPARLDGTARTPAVGDRMRVIAADGKVVWVRPL